MPAAKELHAKARPPRGLERSELDVALRISLECMKSLAL